MRKIMKAVRAGLKNRCRDSNVSVKTDLWKSESRRSESLYEGSKDNMVDDGLRLQKWRRRI
jgi:hypothetical protein